LIKSLARFYITRLRRFSASLDKIASQFYVPRLRRFEVRKKKQNNKATLSRFMKSFREPE
jgi:hypothetical protein